MIIWSLLPLALHAQTPSASLDTAVLRIGEQVKLTLAVSWPTGGPEPTIQWPEIGHPLSDQVEVIHVSGVDTLPPDPGSDGEFQRIERRLRITSFDTGYWAVPPFAFLINGKAMETTALLLEVRHTPLEEGAGIRDIRDIHEAPFSILYVLRRYAPWLLGFFALLGLAWSIAYYIQRRRMMMGTAVVEEPALPLGERVIAALHALEAQRLWQRGDHKLYQAEVTDLLRGYIEERYNVPAMERTSDELIQELRLSSMANEARSRLANMLRFADFVKFAKAVPSPIENERSLAEAIRFVQETMDPEMQGSLHGDSVIPKPSSSPTMEEHAH